MVTMWSGWIARKGGKKTGDVVSATRKLDEFYLFARIFIVYSPKLGDIIQFPRLSE